jgi:hypothetical protein
LQAVRKNFGDERRWLRQGAGRAGRRGCGRDRTRARLQIGTDRHRQPGGEKGDDTDAKTRVEPQT